MRVSYEIPQSVVFSTLLSFVGVFLPGKSVSAWFRCEYASALSELNREECREGNYMSGEIDAYEYHFYTIPIADGSVKNYLIFYCSNLDLWESANKKSIDLPF
ncbi:MAG: hypothetical protein HFI52_05035 [Lachnospiraceae bacterium]|nr:hypothetical protein [Lachnospiraceae bacterium]